MTREEPRGGPLILVVDDDDYVHSTLSAAMRGLRPEILRAVNGAEAMALAQARRPDLAIVDVGLPDVDGYELSRALRREPGLASLRICILTGHLPDPGRARDAGADAIIGKPFRLQELLDVVRDLLRSARG